MFINSVLTSKENKKVKLLIVARREFLVRIRKKSFLLMTILTPLFFCGIVIVPTLLSQYNVDKKTILVIDSTHLLTNTLHNNHQITFVTSEINLDSAKRLVQENENFAVLYIAGDSINHSISSPVNYTLYSSKQLGMAVEQYLEKEVNDNLFQQRLNKVGIGDSLFQTLKQPVSTKSVEINAQGAEKKVFGTRDYIIGLVSGIVVYMFIFMFGSFVLQGVLEEKSNRIVEVIISTIRPQTLLFGKIIGIGVVGLFQVALWILIGGLALTVVTPYIAPQYAMEITASGNNIPLQQEQLASIAQNSNFSTSLIEGLLSIDFLPLLLGFVFYFIFGYIIYAGLFAAVGAAVNDDKDVQQFTFPITLPLLLTMVLCSFIANNPQSSVAYWLSVIPLTSPVAMMIRIPFGVPTIEIITSIIAMLAGTGIVLWMVVKIYRIGILLYGKKPTYKDFWLWIKRR